MRLVLSLIVVAVLAGCSSYRPLYGAQSGGSAVVSSLSDVAVAEQKTRAGQLLRNELLSSISPAGTGQDNRFVLKLDVSERLTSTSRNALTNVERVRYRLSVAYELQSIAASGVLDQAKSFAEVSFDRVGEPIADIQAEQNAKSRAAAELAQDVKLRLSAYFSSHA
jgi:LPS-assembly lipoprotein